MLIKERLTKLSLFEYIQIRYCQGILFGWIDSGDWLHFKEWHRHVDSSEYNLWVLDSNNNDFGVVLFCSMFWNQNPLILWYNSRNKQTYHLS